MRFLLSVCDFLLIILIMWKASMRKKADEDCQHLQTYQVKPDYARCVSIVASASLREMIKPGALAVISPIVLGAY